MKTKMDVLSNEIKVFTGDRKILKKLFKTSFYTVRMALSGKTNTELRRKIRKHALEIGGKEILPEQHEENIDTQICN
jgi:hypothetical protein